MLDPSACDAELEADFIKCFEKESLYKPTDSSSKGMLAFLYLYLALSNSHREYACPNPYSSLSFAFI